MLLLFTGDPTAALLHLPSPIRRHPHTFQPPVFYHYILSPGRTRSTEFHHPHIHSRSSPRLPRICTPPPTSPHLRFPTFYRPLDLFQTLAGISSVAPTIIPDAGIAMLWRLCVRSAAHLFLPTCCRPSRRLAMRAVVESRACLISLWLWSYHLSSLFGSVAGCCGCWLFGV